MRPEGFKKKDHPGGMVQNMIRSNHNNEKSVKMVPESQKQRPGQKGK